MDKAVWGFCRWGFFRWGVQIPLFDLATDATENASTSSLSDVITKMEQITVTSPVSFIPFSNITDKLESELPPNITESLTLLESNKPPTFASLTVRLENMVPHSLGDTITTLENL